MALTITTNISALSGQRHASATETAVQRSVQRLSTGLRINGAADDAADALAVALCHVQMSRLTRRIEAAR